MTVSPEARALFDKILLWPDRKLKDVNLPPFLQGEEVPMHLLDILNHYVGDFEFINRLRAAKLSRFISGSAHLSYAQVASIYNCIKHNNGGIFKVEAVIPHWYVVKKIPATYEEVAIFTNWGAIPTGAYQVGVGQVIVSNFNGTTGVAISVKELGSARASTFSYTEEGLALISAFLWPEHVRFMGEVVLDPLGAGVSYAKHFDVCWGCTGPFTTHTTGDALPGVCGACAPRLRWVAGGYPSFTVEGVREKPIVPKHTPLVEWTGTKHASTFVMRADGTSYTLTAGKTHEGQTEKELTPLKIVMQHNPFNAWFVRPDFYKHIDSEELADQEPQGDTRKYREDGRLAPMPFPRPKHRESRLRSSSPLNTKFGHS